MAITAEKLEFYTPGNAIASVAVATEKEKATLAYKTAPEEQWYKNHRVYRTNRDVLKAYMAGHLVVVRGDENILPIARIRNPNNVLKFPPFLLPNAHIGSIALGNAWRTRLVEYGINDPRYRLADTSLTRSDEMCQRIVQDPTKLANPRSTHRNGGAADKDASACYWMDDDGKALKIVHPDRDRAAMEIIGQQLDTGQPTGVAPVQYDKRIFDALIEVADEMHEQGLINRILEFEGTPNQCLHTAFHPDFPQLLAAQQ